MTCTSLAKIAMILAFMNRVDKYEGESKVMRKCPER